MQHLGYPDPVSRRSFLKGSSTLAATGLLNSLAPRTSFARQAGQPSEAAWRHLADTLSGPLLRSNNFDLRKFIKPYNLRYAAELPDAAALCRTAEDVASAIGWCRQNSFPFVVQSGGHSYAGFSMRRHGLTINLMLMREAVYSNGTVKIGGGVRNQALYALLAERNLATTHGRCPTVGASGFLLGGGIGFNMRAYGIASDQLVASDIITADGKVRTITSDAGKPEADLFWACRGGGGGNFGVNTSFTLTTFEARPVTVFDLTWNGSEPKRIFTALMKALDAGPVGLGTRVSLVWDDFCQHHFFSIFFSYGGFTSRR